MEQTAQEIIDKCMHEDLTMDEIKEVEKKVDREIELDTKKILKNNKKGGI